MEERHRRQGQGRGVRMLGTLWPPALATAARLVTSLLPPGPMPILLHHAT